MPSPEVFGPAQQAINNGISQTFDYGIGMSVMSLFLITSISLNVYLIRFYPKLLILLGQIKELLHADD